MVKAIVIHKTGGPDVMSYEDVDLPPPGPGQVRIKQHAIGVNYIDIYIRSGQYPNQTPFVLGNEGAGEVTQLGEGVKEFKVGDRVAYASGIGGYAEERNIEARLLVKLPESISYEIAAAMMLKGLTAQYLLRRTYKVKPGDTILFHAAAGGVGLIACQWAKALGATVIGTVGTKEKGKLASEAGADHIIYYRDEDFVARVKDITKGGMCEVVYDGVGKTTFPASLDCLKPFGYFVSFGSSSGPIAAFNIGMLAQKGSLYATRPTLFTHSAKREILDEMARDLFGVVSSGKVKIPIHNRYKLSEARKALEALEGRETTGATVLTP
ncbi:MAG TPA: quinone oxidoreductase [Beijerinckiaceae bacterium]|jgi:NADPH2:quinone reductase|nr:quinone oxidoreductase [Beijerinckiaceae bacterium]